MSANVPAERQVALGDLLRRFGTAGLGGLLVLLAVPAFIPVPLPTGIPLGALIALLGAQLALGRPPWLPGWAMRRRIARARLVAGVGRVLSILRRVGLRPRRRHVALAGQGASALPLAGLVLVGCGVIIILPLPFGNQLPSLAVATLGLGLMRRDGVAMLWGYGFAAGAAAWTALLLFAGIEGVASVVPLLG
jgi:hypothetical protein